MGVQQHEPRVVHQLLSFIHRYTADILEDTNVYHARTASSKGELGVEDVLLAISAREAFSFVQPPSQEVLTAMAEQRNKQKLPEPSRRHWLRLPPDEDCLLAPNYQLHPALPLQASTSSDEDDYDYMDMSPSKEAGEAAAHTASWQADPGVAPDAQPVAFSLLGQHDRSGPKLDAQQAPGPVGDVFGGTNQDAPSPAQGPE
ncbi:hypothetical protein WJX84_005266 [Apatococcus fuscideae]